MNLPPRDWHILIRGRVVREFPVREAGGISPEARRAIARLLPPFTVARESRELEREDYDFSFTVTVTARRHRCTLSSFAEEYVSAYREGMPLRLVAAIYGVHRNTVLYNARRFA